MAGVGGGGRNNGAPGIDKTTLAEVEQRVDDLAVDRLLALGLGRPDPADPTVFDHPSECEGGGPRRCRGPPRVRAFWSLPRPRDPKGRVLRALLEEREQGR